MKKTLTFLYFLIALLACSDDNSFPDLPKIPSATKLVFPFESSVCNVGTNITANESTVLFEWEEGVYTDNYELKLRNLETNDLTSHHSTVPEISIVLKRGTPYEWYIISTSNSVIETAQSPTWKFYNAGEAIESYAPFPAEIISPSMAETISTTASEITLDWNGSDVDDDIIGYDVYFSTSNTPEIFQNDLNESILNSVPISLNTIYYWKIITKDSRGNTSDSGIYQFKIN